VAVGEETLAELGVLIGFDDDQAQEATRISNRIRGLLTQIHPALERVLGPKVATGVVLELLARFVGSAGLRAAGRRRLLTVARKAAPRAGEQLITDLLAALDEQTVVVPGSAAAEKVLPRLAQSLAQVLAQRRKIADEVEEILDAQPPAKVLTSMPGIGVRTAARILLEVGDGSALPHRRAPGRLRRTRPGHPPLRFLDPRRTPTAGRQQAAQASTVPLRPHLPGPTPR
jgi:transposase